MITNDRRLTTSRRLGLKNNLDRISNEIYNIKKRYCKTCRYNQDGKCTKLRLVTNCFKKHLRDKD